MEPFQVFARKTLGAGCAGSCLLRGTDCARADFACRFAAVHRRRRAALVAYCSVGEPQQHVRWLLERRFEVTSLKLRRFGRSNDLQAYGVLIR